MCISRGTYSELEGEGLFLILGTNLYGEKLHFYGVTGASPTPSSGCLCLCTCNMYVPNTYMQYVCTEYIHILLALLSAAYVYTLHMLIY